jgi:hypothetical protein
MVGQFSMPIDTFVFSATSELVTGYIYYRQIEKSETESLPAFIARDLEISIAKATDTSQTRSFPMGYLDQYSSLRDSDVGSDYWAQRSEEYIQKAETIIKKESIR